MEPSPGWDDGPAKEESDLPTTAKKSSPTINDWGILLWRPFINKCDDLTSHQNHSVGTTAAHPSPTEGKSLLESPLANVAKVPFCVCILPKQFAEIQARTTTLYCVKIRRRRCDLVLSST